MRKITEEMLNVKFFRNRTPVGYYCKAVKNDGTLSENHEIYCLLKSADKNWFIDEYLKQCNELLEEELEK